MSSKRSDDLFVSEPVDVNLVSPEADDLLIADSEATGDLENYDLVTLTMADLLPDDSGEVVLFTGEDEPVYLSTQDLVVHQGIADTHVTASGVDVTGLHVYTFASGITVYSESEIIIYHE